MAKVLFVSSSGGHFEQLLQIIDGLSCMDCCIVSTMPARQFTRAETYYHLNDFSRDSWWRLPVVFWRSFVIVRKFRPDVVISTGAAPALVVCLVAKILGSKIIWVDSVANILKVSLSGRAAAKIADQFLVQWEHLKDDGKKKYRGSLL